MNKPTREPGTVVELGQVNWALINTLATRPHKHLNITPGAEQCMVINGTHEPDVGGGEVMQEARTVQHLCDLAKIPEGTGYSAHIDARVYLVVQQVLHLRERLDRISNWHSRMTGPAGTFDDYCQECGHAWPCDTRKMADGNYQDPQD